MTNHIYRALTDSVEWPSIDATVAQQLREENMDLLFAGTLESIDPGAWPAEDRVTLERRRRDAIARELLETALLSETLRRLYRAGVPCLILKGAAIARTHYPVSWWRFRSDIDLLVPYDALQDAEAVLTVAGWRATVEPKEPIVSGQRHFCHGEPGAPPLDLHVRLLAPVVEYSPSFAVLWDIRRAVPGIPGPAWTLSDGDALWHACTHIALHHIGEASTLWLFDLDRLARDLDEGGWAIARARARETRTRALCASLLDMASDLFATPLPHWIRAWRAIDDETSDRFLDARSELEIQWLNLRALSGWRKRARWIRAHVLPDAAYMRERYDVRGGVSLPVAYACRAVSGTLRWVGDAVAGRR